MPRMGGEASICRRAFIPTELNATQYSDGCRFYQRCWMAKDICKEKAPELNEISSPNINKFYGEKIKSKLLYQMTRDGGNKK